MEEVETPNAGGVDSGGAICAVVVLAGVTGRLATVRDSLGRNLIDLPRSADQTLLGSWCERFEGSFGETARVPVYVAVDETSPEPTIVARPGGGLRLHVNRDAESSRGTAGILRDLASHLDPDDHVLVVQASDLAWAWTLAEAGELRSRPGDVVLSADSDLRPAGFMRVRCGLLKRVPSVGFVDLKEQFLARNAGSADVHVLRSRSRKVGSLHSLRSYLTLIGLVDSPASDEKSPPASAVAWHADRAIVEAGAEVDPTAMLFDSVVLGGAKVGRRAVVVRSLLGPGVEVAAGEEIVDRLLVAGPGKRPVVRDVAW